jgi:hypothetical protein
MQLLSFYHYKKVISTNHEIRVLYQVVISLSVDCKSEEASSLLCTKNTLSSAKFSIIFFLYFAFPYTVQTEHYVYCKPSMRLVLATGSVTSCKDRWFLYNPNLCRCRQRAMHWKSAMVRSLHCLFFDLHSQFFLLQRIAYSGYMYLLCWKEENRKAY